MKDDKGLQLEVSSRMKGKDVFEFVAYAAKLNFGGAVKTFNNMDSPGKRAWTLVCNSLMANIREQLVNDEPQKEHTLEVLINAFKATLEKNKEGYYLTEDFFRTPERIPFIKSKGVKDAIRNFLKDVYEFDEGRIKTFFKNFDDDFIIVWIEEYRSNIGYYCIIEKAIQTPFSEEMQKRREWRKYRNSLRKETAKPIFTESFGLKDIYIPLRASYIEEKGETKTEDLKDILWGWIDQKDPKDCIRIIYGGPGSGKSSAMKMLAANLAEEGQKVLYIPLHHRSDLIGENDIDVVLNRYFEKTGDFKSAKAFNTKDNDKIIILFDGLDELAYQGENLTLAVKRFMGKLIIDCPTYNKNRLKVQAIITGRDSIVEQINFSHKIKLLPFDDSQRKDWWNKYKKLKPGAGYMPSAYKEGELNEITSQPLLIYLVTLAWKGMKKDIEADTNINKVYSHLLEEVYNRNYHEYGTHDLAKLIINFREAMEEIAIAAWHSGEVRTVTLDGITKHFESIDKKEKVLDVFKESSSEDSAISLLATFYFRKSSDGTSDFEFTHKSFGEYLAACRMVRLIEEKASLVEWVKMFGKQTPEKDLIGYISNELKLKESSFPEWQDKIVKYLKDVLDKGISFEGSRSSFKEEYKIVKNIERALLTMHREIAKIREKSSKESVVNETTDKFYFVDFIRRHAYSHGYLFYCLNLSGADLSSVNLSGAHLSSVNLSSADLSSADLSSTHLSGAYLSGAHLSKTDLSDAYLSHAYLSHAYLSDADLSDANLRHADLRHADLSNTNLRGADLTDADLTDADLTGADLTGAKGI